VLDQFIDLYQAVPKINNLKPQQGEEYLVFKQKHGLPVGLGSAEHYLSLLPRYESFYTFFQENPIFWMIPCDTYRGNIYGFILRGYSKKEYRIFFHRDSPQLVFGFQTFEDFKADSPIILTEGPKDAIMLQQVYPYVLSVQTAGVSDMLKGMLGLLTTKIIIGFDSDVEGKKRSKFLERDLTDMGFKAVTMLPAEGLDYGKYITRPDLVYQLRLGLKGVLSRL